MRYFQFFRTLDRRRESSRFAARDRRGKEADIFTDLRLVVPIVDEATATHVDRIAILRVALTFCRLRKVATKCIYIFYRLCTSYLRQNSKPIELLFEIKSYEKFLYHLQCNK